MRHSILSMMIIALVSLVVTGCGPGDGPGPGNTGTLAVPVLVLPPPANRVLTLTVMQAITFTWQAVADADNYTVEIRTGAGGTFTPSPAIDLTNIIQTNVSVQGFDEDSSYQWRVTANGDGFQLRYN